MYLIIESWKGRVLMWFRLNRHVFLHPLVGRIEIVLVPYPITWCEASVANLPPADFTAQLTSWSRQIIQIPCTWTMGQIQQEMDEVFGSLTPNLGRFST
jgi:hypothetical protein